MSDLRPCPFCNGAAEIERMGSGRQSMIYRCTDCGCSLETSETFIGPHCSWNTRASDAQAEKLAGLLREWMTAHRDDSYPYIATEEALDAYEAGRAE